MEAFTGGRTLMAAGITLAILVLPIVIITGGRGRSSGPELAPRGRATASAPPGRRSSAPRCSRTRSPASSPARCSPSPGPSARRPPSTWCGAVTGLLPGKEALLDPSQLQERFTALPVVIAEWARNPREGFSEIAAAAIMVMLLIVLVMNTDRHRAAHALREEEVLAHGW